MASISFCRFLWSSGLEMGLKRRISSAYNVDANASGFLILSFQFLKNDTDKGCSRSHSWQQVIHAPDIGTVSMVLRGRKSSGNLSPTHLLMRVLPCPIWVSRSAPPTCCSACSGRSLIPGVNVTHVAWLIVANCFLVGQELEGICRLSWTAGDRNIIIMVKSTWSCSWI